MDTEGQEELETESDQSPLLARPAGWRSTAAASPPATVEPQIDGSGSNIELPTPEKEGKLTAVPDLEPVPVPTFVPWTPGDPRSSLTPQSTGPSGDSDLPTVEPAADLARIAIPRRWIAICFGVTLLIYLIFIPKVLDYSSPPTGDQPFYMMMTLSLVQDGDLNLFNNHQNHDEDKFYSLAPHGPGFVGTSAPYPLPPQVAGNSVRPPDEWYNNHMPGLSFLMVPAWIIGSWFSLWWPAVIVFMCIIGALVSLNVFMLAYEQTGKLWIAVAVWAAIAFSNPIMTYSYLIFSELTTGLLLIYAFRRLAMGWGANGPIRLLLIGACIGYIPWLAWRCAPIAACVGVYALVQWWRHYRTHRPVPQDGRKPWLLAGVSRFLPRTFFFLAPIVVATVFIVWYNLFVYGRVIQQDRVPERGDAPIFLWPWLGREELSHFAQAIYGMLFDRLFGLLAFAPVYLLTIIGLIAMFRSNRHADKRLFFAIPFLTLPYLTLIFTFFYWNGLWCAPARYFTTLVPLFSAPLAMSLYACNNWIYRAIYGLMGLYGTIVMGFLVVQPTRFWPLYSFYENLAGGITVGGQNDNPLVIKLNIWQLLPAVDPLDERSIKANTAWITVASLIVLLISYLLMTRWRREQDVRNVTQRKRWPAQAQAGVWASTIVVVCATWYIANFDFLQHKTTLTEITRIEASPPLVTPRGIEYVDGKVYVANYDGKSVGVFDIAAGSYSVLAVTDAGAPLELAKPGDIKRGPDNLLYLLNNGDGDQQLLALKPDGTVVRKIALKGKTPIAAGLQFGSNGNIYVADVVGGGIQEYSKDGGEPLIRITGERGSFNNLIGITITPDDKLYAADSSNLQIQELDLAGQFLRAFPTGCTEFYIAAQGDWLDTSCTGRGIFSINRKTGAMQRSISEPESALPPNAPIGMTYGSDGTLYVIDGNALVAYKVQH